MTRKIVQKIIIIMALLNTGINSQLAYNYSPLNPPIIGDFKINSSPKIGGRGATHTFNQERHYYSPQTPSKIECQKQRRLPSVVRIYSA